MEMEERLVRFTLFGQEFTFYTSAPPEEVDEIVALLRQELEGADGKYVSSIPSSKLLVLGCLRIAARYVRLQREFASYRSQQGRSIDGLIEKMAHID